MIRRAAALALLVGTATGCAGTDRPSGADVQRAARQAGRPVFYLGRTFGGLPLTHAEGASGGALFVYGDCDPEPDAGCAPPVQVQNFRFRGQDWARAVGCYGLPPIRGIPAARHDGLVLFTSSGIVKIYARSEAEDVEAARRLVPVSDGAMEPAPAAQLRLVDDHCDGVDLRSG